MSWCWVGGVGGGGGVVQNEILGALCTFFPEFGGQDQDFRGPVIPGACKCLTPGLWEKGERGELM